MMEPNLMKRTYEAMRDSQDWVLFYDDGNSALFGRADAPASDLAFFKDRRLTADDVAFRRPTESIPFIERPPTKTTALDAYFRGRTRVSTQPHVAAGYRWLGVVGREDERLEIDPANCFAAIREARIALSKNPDDPGAFGPADRLAYRLLTIQEAIAARPGRRQPWPRTWRSTGSASARPPSTSPSSRPRRPTTAGPAAAWAGTSTSSFQARPTGASDYYDLERDEIQAALDLGGREASLPAEEG